MAGCPRPFVRQTLLVDEPLGDFVGYFLAGGGDNLCTIVFNVPMDTGISPNIADFSVSDDMANSYTVTSTSWTSPGRIRLFLTPALDIVIMDLTIQYTATGNRLKNSAGTGQSDFDKTYAV